MKTLTIESKTPPVVEIDTEAGAAYVRFSHEKVARTIPIDTDGIFLAMDLDEKGSVIGIEVVGAKEFSVTELLKYAPLNPLSTEMISHTRYVSAAECACA